MSFVEFLVLGGAATLLLVLLLTFLLPPMEYLFERTTLWFDTASIAGDSRIIPDEIRWLIA
jgi:hypothetical protein